MMKGEDRNNKNKPTNFSRNKKVDKWKNMKNRELFENRRLRDKLEQRKHKRIKK